MASTTISSTRIPFSVLTVFSFLILEVILLTNGAFGGILGPAWYGKLADGKPFYQVYTGIPIIDEILIMPVAYWRGVTRTTPILHLQAVMLCASLQAFPVWASIEQMRNGQKHGILRWAFLYAFCWQYVGTAILLPFYFYIELSHHFDKKPISDPSTPYLKAKALLPCCIIGGPGLYRLLFFPPASVSESQHFIFNSWYHVGSIITFVLVCAVSGAMASTSNKEEPKRATNADLPWIKRTYAFFAAFAGVIHLVVIFYAWNSADPSLSLDKLFVPRFSQIWRADRAERLYVEETLFFDQWDFILVVLQCAIYVSRILEVMYVKDKEWSSLNRSTVVILVSVASTIFSPGLVVSVVLYLREDFIRQQYMDAQTETMSKEGGHKVK